MLLIHLFKFQNRTHLLLQQLRHIIVLVGPSPFMPLHYPVILRNIHPQRLFQWPFLYPLMAQHSRWLIQIFSLIDRLMLHHYDILVKFLLRPCNREQKRWLPHPSSPQLSSFFSRRSHPSVNLLHLTACLNVAILSEMSPVTSIPVRPM